MTTNYDPSPEFDQSPAEANAKVNGLHLAMDQDHGQGSQPPVSDVDAFRTAKRSLEERRNLLRAELSAIDAELSPPSPIAFADILGLPHATPQIRVRAVAPSETPKRRGRPPKSDGESATSRVLTYLKNNVEEPESVSEIGAALGIEVRKVSGIMNQLKKRKAVKSTGKKPHLTWAASE